MRNLILGLLQTSCLHRFLDFGRRDALQTQRSDDSGPQFSISFEGFSMVLKTLAVLSGFFNKFKAKIRKFTVGMIEDNC